MSECMCVHLTKSISFALARAISRAAGTELPATATAEEVVEGAGLLCTPGLVDLHVHVYEHATPLGVNPDYHCLGRGVTTVVDAGQWCWHHAAHHSLDGMHAQLNAHVQTTF